MRTLLQFMSEFSTAKDPFTMLNQFQTEIDRVISDLEEEREVSESLRRHNRDLELQLRDRSLAQPSVAQHNLDVQQQINNHLQKEVAELKQKLAEMTEARNALAASLKEKETQAKVFYKESSDTYWIPLGTGHVTVEFKSTQPPLPTPEEVEAAFEKPIHGHKNPIQSGSAEVQIIDDPQSSVDLSKQVHILLEELKREREDNKAMAGRIESFEKQYSLMSTLYNNQVETIKKYINQTNKIKKLLTTIDEVISESDA